MASVKLCIAFRLNRLTFTYPGCLCFPKLFVFNHRNWWWIADSTHLFIICNQGQMTAFSNLNPSCVFETLLEQLFEEFEQLNN